MIGGVCVDSSTRTVRSWLIENGYPEITEMIDDIESEWKAAGKHTRRNWWDVLSGGNNGIPRTIDERQFPVLQVAQIRQGKTITENAIKAKENEERAPSIASKGRWKRADDSDSAKSKEERELR